MVLCFSTAPCKLQESQLLSNQGTSQPRSGWYLRDIPGLHTRMAVRKAVFRAFELTCPSHSLKVFTSLYIMKTCQGPSIGSSSSVWDLNMAVWILVIPSLQTEVFLSSQPALCDTSVPVAAGSLFVSLQPLQLKKPFQRILSAKCQSQVHRPRLLPLSISLVVGYGKACLM